MAINPRFCSSKAQRYKVQPRNHTTYSAHDFVSRLPQAAQNKPIEKPFEQTHQNLVSIFRTRQSQLSLKAIYKSKEFQKHCEHSVHHNQVRSLPSR